MNVTSVSCNNCGASLDVDEQTRFVTCRHCGSTLEVVRNDNAIFTTAIEQLRDENAAMQQQIRVLELRQQIDALDDAWNVQRQKHVMRDNQGNEHEPEPAGLVGPLVTGAVGAVTSVIILTQMPFGRSSHAAFFPLIVAMIVVVWIVHAIVNTGKYRLYNDARQRYLRRRRELTEQIDALADASFEVVDDTAS